VERRSDLRTNRSPYIVAALACATIAVTGFARSHFFLKRLMLMATLSLLAPAMARITLLFTHDVMAQFLTFDFCVLVFVATDTVWYRRLHPAFGFGATLLIVLFHLTAMELRAKWWLPFVARVFA
jgi:hypothetical protein